MGCLIVLTVACQAANACPAGTIQQQGIGWQGCAPIPGVGGDSASSQLPQAVWEDRWGAFAIDLSVGVVSSKDMPSKRKAEKAALDECRIKGGAKCKIELTYFNQCGVVISGSTGHNTARAASIDRASEIGIDICKKSGDSNCSVYYSECSFPVRVK
jgi:hypothetical protein